MTREEAISIMNVIIHMLESQYDNDRVEEAVDMAIKALEQEPCDDAISREAVKDILDYWYDEDSDDYKQACKSINALPSVEQEPKTGHWIASHIPESILSECSECGFSCGAFTFNYCPNCGAKMESED